MHPIICPVGCKQEFKLLRHHYFDFTDLKEYEIYICPSCNSKLQARNFGIPAYKHYLPPWEIQLAYLKSFNGGGYASYKIKNDYMDNLQDIKSLKALLTKYPYLKECYKR